MFLFIFKAYQGFAYFPYNIDKNGDHKGEPFFRFYADICYYHNQTGTTYFHFPHTYRLKGHNKREV